MGGYTQNTIRDPNGNIIGYAPVTAERPYSSIGISYDPADFPELTEADYERGYVMSGPDPDNPNAPYTPVKIEVNRPVSQRYMDLQNAYDWQHTANVSSSGTTYYPRAEFKPENNPGSNARSIELLVGRDNLDPYILKKLDPNYDLKQGLLDAATKSYPKAQVSVKPSDKPSIEGTYTPTKDFPTSTQTPKPRMVSLFGVPTQLPQSKNPVMLSGLWTLPSAINAAANLWSNKIQPIFSQSPIRMGQSNLTIPAGLGMPTTQNYNATVANPLYMGKYGSKSKMRKPKQKKNLSSEMDILKEMGLIQKKMKKQIKSVKKPKKQKEPMFWGI
jgi:hypothetical protein